MEGEGGRGIFSQLGLPGERRWNGKGRAGWFGLISSIFDPSSPSTIRNVRAEILEAVGISPGDEQAALVATRLVAFGGPARGQHQSHPPDMRLRAFRSTRTGRQRCVPTPIDAFPRHTLLQGQPKGELHEGHRTGRIRCRAASVRRFAAPINATTISSAEVSNVDQIGLICNEYYGRCWRTRGPRYVLRYYYDPSYFPGRGYNYYAGPATTIAPATADQGSSSRLVARTQRAALWYGPFYG